MVWNNVQLGQIVLRVLSDPWPEKSVETLYLFGQTADNQASVLDRAGQLFRQKGIDRICISAAGAVSGYPGFANWQRALEEQAIAKTSIYATGSFELDSLNTLIEAQALIKLADQWGCRRIAVCSSPFHQVRAFMTAVTVALDATPQLKIYSVTGRALPWRVKAAHSQGTLQGTRVALIEKELMRIERYQAKGDLASMETVLEYLDRRDEHWG